MATVKETLQLGDSGIVLGGVDEEGVVWSLHTKPFGASPAAREQVGDLVGGHGTWDATEFYGPRTWEVAGLVRGTHEALHRAEKRLQAAVGVQPFQARSVEPGGFDRQAAVRRGGEVLFTEMGHNASGSYAVARYSAALYQPDPFVYAVEPFTDSTGLPSQTGGLQRPAALPRTWSAVVVSGAMAANNLGTETAYPTFKVFGPLPDFTLSNPATGEWLTVDLAADGESLAEGEWMEVDMRHQRVMLLGQTSRRRAVRGSFFGLPPGSSTVMFGSSVTNTTARAEIEGYSTWI